MQAVCIKCKGRRRCGRSFCPVMAKSKARFKVNDKLPKTSDFFGESPAPFIGHHGYPFLNVGVLSLSGENKDSWVYDAPRYWAKKDFEIPEIVNFRSSLINTRIKAHSQDTNKVISATQEVGMAAMPVEMEVNLREKPKFKLITDSASAPVGPAADLMKLTVTSSPSIHTKVDKVNSDTDLKANDAMLYLYQNNFDENFLSKMLSVGTIGISRNRKLVPTRWSITAVDDNVGRFLVDKLRDKQHSDYMAYFGGYLGNYYLVMVFSDVWSYELFEMYLPKASFNTTDEVHFVSDYENHEGRKSYADNTAGGYYAARLPILEKFISNKRQGSVIALRFITGEYAVPLGVWVVREAVRKTMESDPIKFADKDLMFNYAKLLVQKKFGYDLDNIFKKSVLYNQMKNQSKLSNFF